VSRKPEILLRAFKVYVRPLLEYAACVWSPHHYNYAIDNIDAVQRKSTNRQTLRFISGGHLATFPTAVASCRFTDGRAPVVATLYRTDRVLRCCQPYAICVSLETNTTNGAAVSTVFFIEPNLLPPCRWAYNISTLLLLSGYSSVVICGCDTLQDRQSSAMLSAASVGESIAFGSPDRATAVYKGLTVTVHSVNETQLSLTRTDYIELINVRSSISSTTFGRRDRNENG